MPVTNSAPDTDQGNAWSATLPGDIEGLKQGLDALGAWLRRHDIALDTENKAHLVFEEIVTNIIRYGFDDSSRQQIRVGGLIGDNTVTLTFDDGGRPFDPRKAPAPPRMDSLAKTTIGGRGLMLVRKAASAMEYQRTQEGRNLLAVTVLRS